MYTNTIDNSKNNTDKTFDQVYNESMTINGSEYDVVFSYFKSISKTTTIAGNFTLYLLRISAASGISVMELLDNFRGKPNFEINSEMAYYLNTMKSNATLYGIANLPTPNQTVQRNIVV